MMIIASLWFRKEKYLKVLLRGGKTGAFKAVFEGFVVVVLLACAINKKYLQNTNIKPNTGSQPSFFLFCKGIILIFLEPVGNKLK